MTEPDTAFSPDPELNSDPESYSFPEPTPEITPVNEEPIPMSQPEPFVASRGAASDLSRASSSGNGRNKTDGQITGGITSGVHPNRSHDSNPDPVQEMREQARLDHEFAVGKSAERPSFTRLGPDRKLLSEPQPSNLTISDAQELGFIQ